MQIARQCQYHCWHDDRINTTFDDSSFYGKIDSSCYSLQSLNILEKIVNFINMKEHDRI